MSVTGGGPLPPAPSPAPRREGENFVSAGERRISENSPVQSAKADFVNFQRRTHSLGRRAAPLSHPPHPFTLPTITPWM